MIADALIPVAPFWVVKFGASGKTHGPATEKEANEAAAKHGLPTSNFVTQVFPMDEIGKGEQR